MTGLRRKTRPQLWIPALVGAAVILIGARLIVLSLEAHMAQRRAIAEAAISQFSAALGSELQRLADTARIEAEHAQRAPLPSANAAAPASPGASAELLVPAPPQPRDTALEQSLRTELQAASPPPPAAIASALLGPIRLGSRWIVAARAASTGITAVSYADLDQLLGRADLTHLTTADYDVELSQLDRSTGRSRILLASRPGALRDPVLRAIPQPSGFPQLLPAGSWRVAIRPHNGWYPFTELATDMILLGAAAWLFVLMAHDLARSGARARSALTLTRQRLQSLNIRLANEIEQREAMQRSFDYSRYHDGFTGLPNRRYFMDQLDRGLRHARTHRDYHLAVILLDIDRFRLINDTLGQTAGDELMVLAARRIEKLSLSGEYVLARWGADQFAVLLFGTQSADIALADAKRLQEALKSPFELRKHRLSLSATLGLTWVDSGLQRTEDVLREADIALTAAKAQQPAAMVSFDSAMHSAFLNMVHLEADLHVALERNEMRLLFQPIVDLHSGRMIGAEALLRWEHPVEGSLTPDRFLHIAEETGLILPITRWVVRQACRCAYQWQRRLRPDSDFFISINLSVPGFRDSQLVEFTEGSLRELRLPARLLRFEITEGSLVHNVGAARELLDRLHGMGIQLLLDNFGTGYASLSYLQLFPFQYLKIDRSFIHSLGAEGDSTFVRAIVELASNLGLKAIASGVESQHVAELMSQIGCQYGQGYYFSTPLEAEAAMQLLDPQSRQRAFVEESEDYTQTLMPLKVDHE
jgi:diguanylate cyclase (GGDEF)-like protein